MKNKIYFLIATITLVVLANSFCNAQQTPYTLEYNPDLHLDLGSGLLLDDPFNPKSSPICSFQIDSSNFGTHGTNFSYYLVSDESSLQHSMGIGGYVTVSNINYNVNASFNINSGSFYNSTTLTLAISATADCGYITIIDATAQPCHAADSLCNSGNIPGFRNIYGDNYVVSKDMGVAVTLFLTLQNLSQSTWNSLNASASGSYGQITGGGVSAGISFNQAMQQANSSHNLQVQIATTANLDFTGLDSLIFAIVSGSNNPVNDIQNAFAAALTQKFDCSKAVPIKYHYRAYPCGDNSPLESPCRLQTLTELYNAYYRIKSKQDLLNKLLTSQYYTDFHNQADAAEATRLAAQYTAALNNITTAYYLAKADTTCATSCFTSPVLNDALLDKFLRNPFFACLGQNQGWQYSGYTPTGSFLFTSAETISVQEGGDFFNCSATDPVLAGKKIQVSSTCSVGCNAYANPTLNFFISSSVYPTNANYSYFSGGPSNRTFVMSDTTRVGTDGTIGVELKYHDGQNTCPTLNLAIGAELTISIINPMPAINAIITPSEATICQGDSVTLTANTCAGCSYLWSTGATTQSISVKQAANYTVRVSDGTGNYSTSYWSTITVKQPPVAPNITTNNGSLMVCQGSSTTLKATTDSCNSYTYTWLPGNHVGSTLTGVTSGTYTVVASNGCGATASSLPVTITTVQPPAIPAVTMYAPCLLRTPSVNGASYQWYFNDVAIQGDTTRYCTVTPNNSGNYQVRITDVNGCWSVSADTFFFCPTAINEPAIARQVKVYPNPVNEQLNVQIDEALTGAQLNIYSATGSLVQTIQLQMKNTAINTSNFGTGVYIAEVKLKDAVQRVRWVKM